ncbi:hypothetical protein BDV59DRAFT_200869 [Aspergillus ambiguus]|uniref:putative exopolyphosphatase n=1 Tax=Aspergillus ambiguus TaxID=176160 RepID=UPI003CCD2183
MNPPEHSLLRFLRSALQTHLRFIAGGLSRTDAPVYVIGNPSADLDSIISALVYSYFANTASRRHIPLLNLPNVPSGAELRRLRPEFVKALWLSTQPPIPGDDRWDETPESAGWLLQDHILTVADFATHLQQRGASTEAHRLTADAVLVDWNALPRRSRPGTGTLDGLPAVEFNVVGCVDHHADEHFCGPSVSPSLITTAGSCASLIVQTLASTGVWPGCQAEPTPTPTATPPPTQAEAQVARLALAPILIDTANLTAVDKVTPHDTDACNALRRRLAAQTDVQAAADDRFYTQILTAKQTSLDLLTVDEILARDYKQWTETAPRHPSTPLHIGFCSMVQSIAWIVRKAGGPQAFLDDLCGFAAQRELGIVVVMTAVTAQTSGRFYRELLVCALDEGLATEALEAFVAQAAAQLGLEEWTTVDDGEGDVLPIRRVLGGGGSRRIWLQTDVTKSRKQVAPLMRRAVASL